ncbi:flagellar hook-length control protein FliK [Aureimonas mangrovi]|uniref:flagellar hook-length control protein FliK n=1 Tax=Aureimonas mangrovi TaxID=2758041 RepID=UPI00163DD20F|nr:flagellar hook-length control protein FliK [Aureimonas mangrovi]
MNIPAMPAAPERDAAPAGRKSDRNAFASAFDSAMRSAAGEPDAPRAETEDADAGESAAEEAAADKAAEAAPTAARDVLGFLAAAPKGAGGMQGAPRDASILELAVRTASGPETPKAAEESSDAAMEISALDRKAGAGAGKAGEEVRARSAARLEVLHMETHFEPTNHEAVLVEGAAKGGGAAQSVRAGAFDLRAALTALAGQAREDARADTGSSASSAERSDLGSATPGLADGLGERAEPSRERAKDGSNSRGERFAMLSADRPGTAGTVTLGATAMGATAGNPGVLPVTMQVAERIIDVFAPTASGESAPGQPASDAHLRLRAGGAALKTLTLQLQPETLGTLDVSMRLVDGELRIELAASRADAARLLGEDRASLQTLLEKAGFTLDEGSITVVTRDTAPAPSARGGETAGERGGQGERAMAGNGEPRRDGDGQRRSFPQNDSSRAVNPTGRSVDSGSGTGVKSGSVYL